MSLEQYNRRLEEWAPEDLRSLEGIVSRVHAERREGHPQTLPGTSPATLDTLSNEDFLILAALQIGRDNLAVLSSLARYRPHPRDVPMRDGIDYWAVFTLLGWGRTMRRGRITKNGWTDIIHEPDPFVMPVTTEGVFALAYLRTLTNIAGQCVRLH